MALTVKAYLMKQPETNTEIRRFSVDQDVSTNYVYMRGKVTQMFPALNNEKFELYWKDPENDLILFSSDDELTEALGFVCDGIFKVHIKVSGSEAQGRNDDEQNVPHPGVVCDGCEGPVCGPRYKCMVCHDYDLCSSCENKGIHEEHDMMRMVTPKAGVFMGHGFFPPPPPFGHPPPPPFHHGGPPPPPPHHGHGAHHPPGPHGPYHGPWGRGRGGQHGPWRHFMKNCWKAWMGESESTEGQDKDDKEKQEQEKKQKGADCPKPDGARDDNDSSDDGDTNPSAEEYLKTVGQNVAAMLDPLGIDVEIDVEHNGKQQKCGTGGHPPMWGMWGPGMRSGGCPRKRSGRCGRRNQAEKKSEESQENKTESKQGDGVEMETGEVNSAEASQSEQAMEEETANAAQTKIPTENNRPTPDKEWTIIDSRQNEQSTPEGTTGLYPDVPRSLEPEDPAIANALDHMKAMGFGNDGGWLTCLLQTTNGDINKALDAIRANRAK